MSSTWRPWRGGKQHQKKVESTQKNSPAPISFTRYGSMGAGQPKPAKPNSTIARMTKMMCSGAVFRSFMAAGYGTGTQGVCLLLHTSERPRLARRVRH